MSSDAKLVKLNYLTILKLSGVTVDETTSCKELKAQLLENEQRILNVLNSTTRTDSMSSWNIDNSSLKRRNENSEDSASHKKAKYQ